MKQHLRTVLSLTIICGVLAVLLAVTNAVTAPIIEENSKAASQAALLVVMPEGKDFEEVDISLMEFPDAVKSAYKEAGGGHVITVESAGYSSGMLIMCGIDKDGKITGATCLSSGETLGVEKTYGEKAVGATLDSVESLEGVSGATKTVNGYKSTLKTALGAATILSGGSVDLRDEATILKENLSNALPDAEGEFAPAFLLTEIKTEGVTAVYEAVNKSGYVFLVGESFYGVKADGTVLIDGGDEAFKKSLADDVKAISSITLTDIDITSKELPGAVEKAQKTSNGDFVFEVAGTGYGILGDKYTASGETIKIKVAVSRDGKVLACQTLSQKESEGIGDACANPEFYNQFVGKTQETYSDIDGISGATITTNGYKTAVLRALEAAKILKGV